MFSDNFYGVIILYITVSVNHIEKKRSKVDGQKFFLANKPQTVEELIRGAVHTCINLYNESVLSREGAKPFSFDEISNIGEIGKLAFGINYYGKPADEASAAEDAIKAYKDGMLRIFIKDTETRNISYRVNVYEGEKVTFIIGAAGKPDIFI